MTDRVTNEKIEDVLSSIRRLVANGEGKPLGHEADKPAPGTKNLADAIGALGRRNPEPAPVAGDALVLTDAVRISGRSEKDAQDKEPSGLSKASFKHTEDADLWQADATADAAQVERPVDSETPAERTMATDAPIAADPSEERRLHISAVEQERDEAALSGRFARLEEAVDDDPQDWEPDGSEVASAQPSMAWTSRRSKTDDNADEFEQQRPAEDFSTPESEMAARGELPAFVRSRPRTSPTPQTDSAESAAPVVPEEKGAEATDAPAPIDADPRSLAGAETDDAAETDAVGGDVPSEEDGRFLVGEASFELDQKDGAIKPSGSFVDEEPSETDIHLDASVASLIDNSDLFHFPAEPAPQTFLSETTDARADDAEEGASQETAHEEIAPVETAPVETGSDAGAVDHGEPAQMKSTSAEPQSLSQGAPTDVSDDVDATAPEAEPTIPAETVVPSAQNIDQGEGQPVSAAAEGPDPQTADIEAVAALDGQSEETGASTAQTGGETAQATQDVLVHDVTQKHDWNVVEEVPFGAMRTITTPDYDATEDLPFAAQEARDVSEDSESGENVFEEETILDEEALRALVVDLVHEELQGALGERITRNVRKLVRREIHRALASRDFD